MNPGLREHRFTHTALQVDALATAIATQLQTAIAERSHASLAVSGGRSPVALFQRLRTLALDWPRVCITLVDERCVPEHHPDSNARLVREHLLQDAAAAATFVGWLDGLEHPHTLTPTALCRYALERLRPLPTPWDVAVLGMGEDGHTASWFPHSVGLHEAMTHTDAVCWVQPAQAPHLRLTLTRAAVLACRHLHLAWAGAAKQAIYTQAQRADNLHWPVSVTLAHASSLDVWIAE